MNYFFNFNCKVESSFSLTFNDRLLPSQNYNRDRIRVFSTMCEVRNCMIKKLSVSKSL